ncbi:MAG TPA: Crp/Fnr family transcriptional regulator [Burkholderiaceae bacterium]|jgi:CRP-like cAMP-binding protein
MISDKELEEIAGNPSPLRVKQNMCVVNPVDHAEGAFWIVYGQVQLAFHANQGNEKTLEILGEEMCFGLDEMLLERPHQAFMKTTADSMLLHTERDAMLQIAKKNFGFARELMTCVSRQFYALVHDIESYSLPARQRLATYLLRQSQRQSDDNIQLISNKALIASRLSLTPETLSRLFHDFSDEGLIEVTGRHIKIIDGKKMASLLL